MIKNKFSLKICTIIFSVFLISQEASAAETTELIKITPPQPTGINFQVALENPSKANPSIFYEEFKPGTRVYENIIVKNNGKTTETIFIYAADQTKTTDGNSAYRNRTDIQENIGKWVIAPLPEYTFQAGETKLIPFTINIPETTPEGEYTGGIIVEKITEEPNNPIKTAVRVITPIVKIKVTQNPVTVERMYRSTRVAKPFFYITTGIFLASMIYIIIAGIRMKKSPKSH